MRTNQSYQLFLISLLMIIGLSFGCSKEKHDSETIETSIYDDDKLVNKVLNFAQMATDLKEGKFLKNAEWI